MLTIESTSYGTTTTQGTVRTTATRTLSREFPIVGCAVEDSAAATTTEARDTQRPRARAVAVHVDVKEGVVEDHEAHALAARACEDPVLVDAIVMPTDHYASHAGLKSSLTQESSPNALGGRKMESFHVIEAPAVGFTAYFYLTKVRKDYLTGQLLGKFGLSAEFMGIPEPASPPPGWTAKMKRKTSAQGNDTTTVGNPKKFSKRLADVFSAWTQSHISVPPYVDWHDTKNGYRSDNGGAESWKYQRDASECQGQYVSRPTSSTYLCVALTVSWQVYVLEEDVDASHPVRSNQDFVTCRYLSRHILTHTHPQQSFSNLGAAGRMERIDTQDMVSGGLSHSPTRITEPRWHPWLRARERASVQTAKSRSSG